MKRTNSNNIIRITAATAVAVFFAALAVCSCQKDATAATGRPEPDLSSPISFTVNLPDGPATRGLYPITNDNIGSVGIFAGYELDRDFDESSVCDNYISNTRYVKYSSTNTWSWYYPTYWPIVGQLSFFAYSPFVEDFELADNHGYPSVEYTPAPNVIDQIDLCMAEPKLNCTKSLGNIPLHFRHVLTGLVLKMNYIGTMPSSDYYLLVDQVTLSGIIGTKTVKYIAAEPYYSWEADDDARKTASYVLKRTGTNAQVTSTVIPSRNEGNDNHQLLNPNYGQLYLLPQTVDKAKISLLYGYYQKINGIDKLVLQFEVESQLPGPFEWKAGVNSIYNMTLDIGNSCVIDITAEEGETMIEPYVPENSTVISDYME